MFTYKDIFLKFGESALGVYSKHQNNDRQIFVKDLRSIRISYWHWDTMVQRWQYRQNQRKWASLNSGLLRLKYSVENLILSFLLLLV